MDVMEAHADTATNIRKQKHPAEKDSVMDGMEEPVAGTISREHQKQATEKGRGKNVLEEAENKVTVKYTIKYTEVLSQSITGTTAPERDDEVEVKYTIVYTEVLEKPVQSTIGLENQRRTKPIPEPSPDIATGEPNDPVMEKPIKPGLMSRGNLAQLRASPKEASQEALIQAEP